MKIITLEELKNLVEHMETIGAEMLNVDIDCDASVQRIDYDELDAQGRYLHTYHTWFKE